MFACSGSPAGKPQAGFLPSVESVPARVFGSHVRCAETTSGTLVPSGHSAPSVVSNVHCPLTRLACPKDCPPGVRAAVAHPSPHGLKYQSLVTGWPLTMNG